MPQPPSLSIVIPVLDEEKEIAGILTTAISLLEERGGEWEIIVVDNASTDRTLELAAPFVDGRRVRVLRNDVNRGKGFSVRRGMLAARGDLRLMCDADCMTSLSSLPSMERAAREVHVVVGSRVSAGARVARQQALRRRVVGVGFITLTRVAMGRLPRDIYCGFKLWRAGCAQAVFGQVQLEGWVFDAEALAMARDMGYSMREMGIEWCNRPDSRLSIRNTLLPVVGELRAARRNVHRAAAAYRAEQARVQATQAETVA
jgi:glycosyltransferase involved in cell wall biosynthesis